MFPSQVFPSEVFPSEVFSRPVPGSIAVSLFPIQVFPSEVFPPQVFARSPKGVPPPPPPPPPPSVLDLGRIRTRGRNSVSFAVTGQSLPVVTITEPAGSSEVPLATSDGITFSLTQTFGGNYFLGAYAAIILVENVQFEIVAGGDYGGMVLSLFTTQNSGGWQVLVQLQSGALIMGLNPKLTVDQ